MPVAKRCRQSENLKLGPTCEPTNLLPGVGARDFKISKNTVVYEVELNRVGVVKKRLAATYVIRQSYLLNLGASAFPS